MGSGYGHADSDHGKCSPSRITGNGNQGSRTWVRSSIVLAKYRCDEPEWQIVSCRRRLAKNEPYHLGLQLGRDYSHDNIATSFGATRIGYIADLHRQHNFPENFAKKIHSMKTALRFKVSEAPIDTFTYSHANIQINSFPQ